MSDPIAPQSNGQAPTQTPQAPQVGAEEADDFDKERAMSLIRKLQDFEKSAKPQLKEYEAFKAAQAEREKKLAEEQGNFKALYEQQQAEAKQLAAKLAELEATQRQHAIARELGLPMELADRLRGDTPAELKADAQKLLALIAPPQAGGTTASPVPANAPTNPATTRQAKASFDPKNPPRLGSVDWTKT